jgi:hypothetical protein
MTDPRSERAPIGGSLAQDLPDIGNRHAKIPQGDDAVRINPAVTSESTIDRSRVDMA